jgi:hypothetical protein
MDAAATARRAERKAKSWVERLARVGYSAAGFVYIVIGALAIQAAMGPGGETTDKEGAFLEILSEPFGQVLLAIIALGFFGYMAFQFVRAVEDTENLGDGLKGYGRRAVMIVIGLVYASLAVTAIQLILGFGGGNSNSSEDWTAWLLGLPYGRWIVGGIGVIAIGVGLYQFYKVFTSKFRDKFRLYQMNEAEERAATISGRIGVAARGFIIMVIGALFIQAAWRYDPEEAGGMGDALQPSAQQPHGPYLLGLGAVGLIVYGIH